MTTVPELWRVVPGFEEYEVSSAGRVRRVGRATGAQVGHIRKPGRLPRGYLYVPTYRGNVQRNAYVHRMVALAFLGNPPCPGAHVNHKNFDKADNRVENLEWVTPSDNLRHTWRHDRQRTHDQTARGVSNGRAKLTPALAAAIRSSDGRTISSLAHEYGVSRSTVRRVLSGESWGGVNDI